MRIPILAILCIAARAGAEPPRTPAAELFEQGRELAKHGSYAEACERFAKSYELDPAAGTAINFADCQEHLGHLSRAWELFDLAAKGSERASNAVRAQFARDRASALLPRLATIVLTIADRPLDRISVSIQDRDVVAAAEVHQYVDPGEVVVVVVAPERRFTTTVHAVAGATIDVDVPASGAVGALPRDRRWLLGAAIAGGAGTIALVVGGVYGISAIRHYNQAFTKGYCFSTPSGDECSQAGLQVVDDAHSRADVSTGMFVTGALLVAGGVTAYFLAPRGHALEVRPAIAPGSASVTLGGRF